MYSEQCFRTTNRENKLLVEEGSSHLITTALITLQSRAQRYADLADHWHHRAIAAEKELARRNPKDNQEII